VAAAWQRGVRLLGEGVNQFPRLLTPHRMLLPAAAAGSTWLGRVARRPRDSGVRAAAEVEACVRKSQRAAARGYLWFIASVTFGLLILVGYAMCLTTHVE
jgi:hypothetical protein